MRVRAIAALLSFVGPASIAYADVSLTDEQVYARALRYSARTPSQGVIAGLAAGQVPRLIDASGLEWFINDEVTYATTSSAVGAASDAAFVGPVEATTAGGGSELSVLADAFDGYNGLLVSVAGAAAVSYNQAGPAASDCNGRQILTPARTIGGLTVSRKIYVPANDGFARWLNLVSNPTGAPVAVTLQMVSDLGSDAGTTIGTTSSGDAVVDATDDWVTTYEAFVGTSSPSPRLAHVLQSTRRHGTPLVGVVREWRRHSGLVLQFLGARRRHRGHSELRGRARLTGQRGGEGGAACGAAAPASACLTSADLQSLSNMVPGIIPNGPAPTGPASITITSPTANPTYTATTPFVSIGGLAGPASLTQVSWSSNRGFSGTAQGLSEWAIPSAAVLPGVNVFTVTAQYAVGLPLTDTITITSGALQYQLPEGATGSFFSTDLLIANPNATEVEAGVRFLKPDGTSVALPSQTLPPHSRLTIPIDSVAGLEAFSGISSIVTSSSGAPLIVERSMFWDATSYGSHGSAAGEGAATQFLFSEGSQGFFDTFLLLANASETTAANVTVQFLPELGLVVTRTYEVPPNTRLTVYAGGIPEIVNTSFSTRVQSDLPIVAERAMYFGTPLFSGGHNSIGVPLPATRWFFGEGATGSFFNTFFLLGNTSSRAANVEMTYRLLSGASVVVNRVVPAFSRLTINAATEHASLADASFALEIKSDEPVAAERSMYWSLASGAWYEGHNATGVNEPGLRWGLAEGRVGTDRDFQTYILIGNTTMEEASVRVTFLRVGGGTVSKIYPLAASSRFNLHVNSMVPELSTRSSAPSSRSSTAVRSSSSGRSTARAAARCSPPAPTRRPCVFLEATVAVVADAAFGSAQVGRRDSRRVAGPSANQKKARAV